MARNNRNMTFYKSPYKDMEMFFKNKTASHFKMIFPK